MRALVALREDLGLSQSEVARRLRITHQSVSQLERTRDPRLSTVLRYARAIGARVYFTVEPKADEGP